MDQRLMKQTESLDRQAKRAYVAYIEKAEKAFQKERFGSARYNLSQADQILPSELLKEKIRTCEENSIRVEKAQELIRQGYLLQKQKKDHEALRYFLQSLEVWEMGHIRAIAENLRKRLPRSSINKAYQAEADHRYEEAIGMYHEAYRFFFMAKVYYRLAEQEEEYLPEAISFLLTITHNPKYLDIYETKGPKHVSMDNSQLAEDLQKKLEDLVHHYKTMDEGLSEDVSIHWETEKQAIMFLRKITQKDKIVAKEICTPAFAGRFGKSYLILERLMALKPLWEQDEDFWVTGALFSEAREALLLLFHGEAEEAMAELPSGGIDEFVEYSRQRIFFRLCMKKVQGGESNAKKYLVFALPLIQRFKKYQREIAQMAQEIGEDLDKLRVMDSLLHYLIRFIQSKELLEIASYIMSYKANAMFYKNVITAKNAQGIYRRALEIFPDNEFAKDELEEAYTHHQLEGIVKAIKRGNLKKATNITIQSEDEEVEELYFEFAEVSLGELRSAPLDDREKIFYLNDLFRNCEKVDPDHYVLDQISEYIDELGGELTI